MTWLFTQVWLWSLAAFLVGSVLTWLLFALPLRRRLRALEARLAELDAGIDTDRPAYDDYGREYPDATITEAEPVSWDLLRADDEPEPVGDRPFRGARLGAVRPVEDASSEWDDSATVVSEAFPGAGTDDDSELRLEEQRELAVRQEAGERGRVTEPGRQAPRPTAPPELDQAGTELADGSSTANTWFSEPDRADDTGVSERSGGYEWSGTLDGSGVEDVRGPDSRQRADPEPARESDSAYLSGQLRSLFEPLGGPGVEPERRAIPYVPPVGVEATQHLPRVPDEPSPHDEAAPAAEPEVPVEAADDAGYAVKGHFASRQYHTPESPRFERITAQVWFRTAADAEQAGFEPWDGRRRG